jgi:ribosomal protein S10
LGFQVFGPAKLPTKYCLFTIIHIPIGARLT